MTLGQAGPGGGSAWHDVGVGFGLSTVLHTRVQYVLQVAVCGLCVSWHCSITQRGLELLCFIKACW